MPEGSYVIDTSTNKCVSKTRPRTIADLLLYLPTPTLREQFEEFRVEWEQVHGPTDMTRRYTSQLPLEEQAILFDADPKAFFRGLPPFAQDYLRGKMDIAKEDGRLDDMPASFLRLYLSGCMKRSPSPPGL